MSSAILTSLSNLFGEVPSLVIDNTKYLTFEESSNQFNCVLCDIVISKTAKKTLEAHLNSKSHRKKASSEAEVIRALTKTFDRKIPQIVENNIEVLDVVKEGYECAKCLKLIEESKDPKISVENFLYHLTSSGHKDKLKDHDKIKEHLEDIYGCIPLTVSNNAQFLQLTKCRKDYMCTPCNVVLRINVHNMKRNENVLTNHFRSGEHVWAVKLSKVLALVPELQNCQSVIHTYMIRNIDFIRYNGTNLFCSLCHFNIKRNLNDTDETVENLKHHTLSSDHVENVFSRQNIANKKLPNLVKLFGDFTSEILKDLKYIELNNRCFYCSICNMEICTDSDIKGCNVKIISHLKSNFHKEKVNTEEDRCTKLVQCLEFEFGKMPSDVEDNLEYIEFVQGNSFYCNLCDANFLERNLERHLSTNGHIQAMKEEESVSDSLAEDLEDALGQNYQSACIDDNWSNLEYESDSGNFRCTLCDETILVNEGTKKEEVTLLNFTRHLYSTEHMSRLKEEANKFMKTSDKLESIFGGIPICILNNLHVLHQRDEASFFCDECEVEIRLGNSARTSKQNFLQHFRGSLHKSNMECIESSIDNAFEFLDMKFGVPEFLLRDIDYWDSSDDDSDEIYCTVCQQAVFLDFDDLTWTRESLADHVDCERHNLSLVEK